MEERIILLSICGLISLLTVVNAGPILNDAVHGRPFYIECANSDECDKSECCAVNQGRFSPPTCRPRQELGDFCRPENEPFSSDVTYPDNMTVSLRNVYLMFCPCQGLYTCSIEGKCENPAVELGFNYLDFVE